MSDGETRTLKRWLVVIAGANALVAAGSLVLASVAGARAGHAEAATEVRVAAKDVLREEWMVRLEAETRRIATEAASAAADKAVRDAVGPVALEVAVHRAMDEQRQRETERRVEVLENRKR
jgi:hypothetical protein